MPLNSSLLTSRHAHATRRAATVSEPLQQTFWLTIATLLWYYQWVGILRRVGICLTESERLKWNSQHQVPIIWLLRQTIRGFVWNIYIIFQPSKTPNTALSSPIWQSKDQGIDKIEVRNVLNLTYPPLHIRSQHLDVSWH